MRNKFIALPVLALALGQPAFAGTGTPVASQVSVNLSTTTSTPGATNDYTFQQNGLTGSFTSGIYGTVTGYQLNVTGSGPSIFASPSNGSIYTVSNTSYTLDAVFNTAGVFQNGSLVITGTPSGTTNASTYSTLLTEQLTAFGYNASEAAIGFTTNWSSNGGWAAQPSFTGGSNGDITYLFNEGGLGTGVGPLSNLISEFTSGNFHSLTLNQSFESIAAVPLPLPAVLFGTGLTALMGLGRQRRNQAKSI